MHYVLLRILILFKDKKLLVTGGTGSIGASICNYFNNNGCKEIFATTTNLNKVNLVLMAEEENLELPNIIIDFN